MSGFIVVAQKNLSSSPNTLESFRHWPLGSVSKAAPGPGSRGILEGGDTPPRDQHPLHEAGTLALDSPVVSVGRSRL